MKLEAKQRLLESALKSPAPELKKLGVKIGTAKRIKNPGVDSSGGEAYEATATLAEPLQEFVKKYKEATGQVCRKLTSAIGNKFRGYTCRRKDGSIVTFQAADPKATEIRVTWREA
jgi:hypothetical protein